MKSIPVPKLIINPDIKEMKELYDAVMNLTDTESLLKILKGIKLDV